jgi:hypothetical protein
MEKGKKSQKGQWGGVRPGAGRPPMSGNLVSMSYREAFARAIEQMEAGPNNLAAWAQDNPTAFWTIASRLLPISMAADITSGGEPLGQVSVVFHSAGSGPLLESPEYSEEVTSTDYVSILPLDLSIDKRAAANDVTAPDGQ